MGISFCRTYNVSRAVTYRCTLSVCLVNHLLVLYLILYSVLIHFYLTFKTIALHPLSLLPQIFSTVWTALCILNQLVFCFIMLLKHFLFSYVSVCLFSAPAQGEPGGVYQSTTDSEARQIQWRSECFHFSLHPAHQRPGSLLGIRYGEMHKIVLSVVFSLLS